MFLANYVVIDQQCSDVIANKVTEILQNSYINVSFYYCLLILWQMCHLMTYTTLKILQLLLIFRLRCIYVFLDIKLETYMS